MIEATKAQMVADALHTWFVREAIELVTGLPTEHVEEAINELLEIDCMNPKVIQAPIATDVTVFTKRYRF